MSQYVCWVLLVSAAGVLAYPDGAPLEACGSMFPTGHHADAFNSTSPYSLTTDKTFFNSSETITVTVTTTGQNYEGLFVQARLVTDCSNTSPVGSFRLDSGEANLKTVACNGVADSAVTHSKTTQATSRRFTWVVPNTQGHIYFRATVVKTEKEFWTNVFSGVIRDVRVSGTPPSAVTCQPQLTGSASATTGLASLIFVAVFWFLASFF